MFALIVAALAVGTDTFPKAQADIASACGASPVLAVAWNDFGSDESGARALAATELGFVGAAFTTVCKDAGLKAEVGKQIAKVVLRQANGASEPILYISKGTLYIEYLWVENEPAPDAAFVAAEIADRLRGGGPEAP